MTPEDGTSRQAWEELTRRTWEALPLWRRVQLCAQCGWLDAVWEVCPPLGRWLDLRLHGPRGRR